MSWKDNFFQGVPSPAGGILVLTPLILDVSGLNFLNIKEKNISRHAVGFYKGSGVALANGLCAASFGTDTGGSVRIPSAWNKLVGFKTSI